MIFCRRIVLTIVSFSVVTFIAGCGPAALSFLKKDSLEKERGLMTVRLRIKDSSRSFLNANEAFSVQVEGGGAYAISMGVEEGRWLGEKLNKYRHAYTYWKKEDDAYYFDQYYFMEAKPGRYYFKTLTISTDEGYYDFPLNFACDLVSNSFIVLGTVDINIDKRTGRFDELKISYRTELQQDDHEKTQIVERFKAKYPALSKTLAANGTAGKAFYAYYEMFIPSDKPRYRKWDDIPDSGEFQAHTNGPYNLSADYSDKNAYGYAGMKDGLSLPGNYTISYKIRWMEGIKDAFYGMRLAQDDKNAYYFGVSAEGRPAIWIKKDGSWQAKPPTKEMSNLHASKKEADDFSVEALNNQITYKINDEPVGSFAGTLALGSAYAGFFVSGKQKVEVDLFKIIEKQ